MPKILNHNLTVNIFDGDYSGETLTIPANFVGTGTLTTQAKTTVNDINTVKNVKLRNLIISKSYFEYVNINSIIFGENWNGTSISFERGQVNCDITYCDFGLNKTSYTTSSIGVSVMRRSSGAFYVGYCRFYQQERCVGLQANPGNNSKIDVENSIFYDSNYGIYVPVALVSNIYSGTVANQFFNVKHEVYRASSRGLNVSETNLQALEQWQLHRSAE